MIKLDAIIGSGSFRRLCRGMWPTSLMKKAMNQLQLSARAYHRILKLARTIANLAGSEKIAASHLAEALQYRPRISD
jgi:magnesium chelatase family protein